MSKHSLKIHIVNASLAALCFAGCGPQDKTKNSPTPNAAPPAAVVPPAEPQVVAPASPTTVEPPTEKEIVLQKRKTPTTVEVGIISSNEVKPELKQIPTGATCPADTLCIHADFIGEPQIAELAMHYPDLVKLRATQKLRHYYLSTSLKTVQLQGELIEFSEGMHIVVCSNLLEIRATEIKGTGTLDTSGPSCLKKDAGSIHLFAPTIGNITVVANGSDGKNGSNANVPEAERHAKNGDPNAAFIKVSLNTLDTTYGLKGTEKPEDEADSFKILDRLGLLTEADFNEWLKGENQNAFLGWNVQPTKCNLSSDSKKATHPDESGIFVGASGRLENFSALHGSSANKFWKGGDGEPAGRGGEVEVIALRSDLEENHVQNKEGKGGIGGKGYIQQPGVGVAPAQTEAPFSFTEVAYLNCTILGTVHSKRISREHTGVFKVRESGWYTQGEGYRNEPLDRVDWILGDSHRGFDGSEFTVPKGERLDGISYPDGESPEPHIELLPTEETWVWRVSQLCPTCDPQKLLKSRAPDSEETIK